MAYYSIGGVAKRYGINPVTLRAWQRRYGSLKLQRSEGGRQLFDEEDIRRIEGIKRWISNDIPVGEAKALLETSTRQTDDNWSQLQGEMINILRIAHPLKLRARVAVLDRVHPVDALIDHIYLPVYQRLIFDHNTSHIMNGVLDGTLIEYVTTPLSETRRKSGKDALLVTWDVENRARLWLEAWRLSQSGWRTVVLVEPTEPPRPELFPEQTLFIWIGITPARRQNELLQHWNEQGYEVIFHSP